MLVQVRLRVLLPLWRPVEAVRVSPVAGGAVAERGRHPSPGHDAAGGQGTNPGSLPGGCGSDGRAPARAAALRTCVADSQGRHQRPLQQLRLLPPPLLLHVRTRELWRVHLQDLPLPPQCEDVGGPRVCDRMCARGLAVSACARLTFVLQDARCFPKWTRPPCEVACVYMCW